MSKSDIRLRAIALRRSGVSVKDIARELGVAASTVSVWCREVVLSKAQSEKLRAKQYAAGHKGRLLGAQINRARYLESRLHEEREAKTLVGLLSQRDRLMLGIGLYWGEGSKTRTSATALVNSDPAIVRFALNWFIQLAVQREDFRPYISITEEHRSREQEIKRFWVKALGLPKSQFGSVIYLPVRNKKVYENHNLYYGSVALRIRRGSRLKYRILGLIEACKQMPG